MLIIYPSKRLECAKHKSMWQEAWPDAALWVMHRYSEIIYAKWSIRLNLSGIYDKKKNAS